MPKDEYAGKYNYNESTNWTKISTVEFKCTPREKEIIIKFCEDNNYKLPGFCRDAVLNNINDALEKDEKNEKMLEDVKVGDELFSLVYDWGVVEDIDVENLRITVKFKNETDTFTLDGKMYETDMYPTLFWDEVKVEAPNKPLAVDTKVTVWDEKDKRKYKRYFKRFNNNGKIVCFCYGATSWSTNYGAQEWNYWERTE